MVCREIITCPLVQQLRGDFQLSRIIYCETSAEPCALRALLGEGKPVPATLLPSGEHRPPVSPAACLDPKQAHAYQGLRAECRFKIVP